MRILIVDDSSISRKFIRKELEAGEFTVFEAASGSEALEQVVIVRPHLITMDVHMPGMNGFEACRAIREMNEIFSDMERVPVVFITTDDTVEGRIQGFQSGATDFLAKPFLKGTLLNMVKHLLNPEQVYQGLNTLLVEESQTLRRIIAEPLEALGMNVVFANDGQAAFDMVREDRDRFHLVVTGYFMPGMNGDMLCRRLREDLGLKHLPIVLMSTLEDEKTILSMFQAGVSDFIPKPFVKEVFLARINRLISESLLNDSRREQLEAMEKFTFYQDALARFTSSEFNSPIANILACADRIRDKGADGSDGDQLAAEIRESSHYLLQLINEMASLNQYYGGSAETAPGKESSPEGKDPKVIPFPRAC